MYSCGGARFDDLRIYSETLLTEDQLKILAGRVDELGYYPTYWYHFDNDCVPYGSGMFVCGSYGNLYSAAAGNFTSGLGGGSALTGLDAWSTLSEGLSLPHTMAMWARSADSKGGVIFSVGKYNEDAVGLASGGGDKVFVFVNDVNGVAKSEEVTVTGATTSFHHYAIVTTEAGLALFVDGTQTATLDHSVTSVNAACEISSVYGNTPTGLQKCTAAAIDDLRIYSGQALTAANIGVLSQPPDVLILHTTVGNGTVKWSDLAWLDANDAPREWVNGSEATLLLTGDTTLVMDATVPGGNLKIVSEDAVTLTYAEDGGSLTGEIDVSGLADGSKTVFAGVTPASASLLAGDGTVEFAVPETKEITCSMTLASAGTVLKTGKGKLNFRGAGGNDGSWRVLEGNVDTRASLLKAPERSSYYVGTNGVVFTYGYQAESYLPLNALLTVDGGRFTMEGTNPFKSSAAPYVTVTNSGTFVFSNKSGSGHLKVRSLDVTDSTVKVTDTAAAYNSQGAVLTDGKVSCAGTCEFLFAEGNPNRVVASSGGITVEVAAGADVTWGWPVGSATTMNCGEDAVVRFADTCATGNSVLTVNGGTVECGGAVAQLSLSADTVLRPGADGAPLVVTTLTLPAEGKVTVDLTEVDWTGLLAAGKAVSLLTSSSITEASAEKFEFRGEIPAIFTRSFNGSIVFVPPASPELTWNSGSGAWTATSFNNVAGAYLADGFHEVSFADTANGSAEEPATVQVAEARTVKSMDFTAADTPYVLSGSGAITVPTIGLDGGAAVTIGNKLNLTTLPTSAVGRVSLKNVSLSNNSWISLPDGTEPVELVFSKVGKVSAKIGAGRTLILDNHQSSTLSVSDTAGTSLIGDITSKLVIRSSNLTAPNDFNYHTDLLTDGGNYKGSLEVSDCGYAYINCDARNWVATRENPIRVTGKSILSISGDQSNNRMPYDGWICATDESFVYMTGANAFKKTNPPSVILTNSTLRVKPNTNTHVFLRDIEMTDGTLRMYNQGKAYRSEGICVKGTITSWGDSIAYCDGTGDANKLRFVSADKEDADAASGTVAVEDGTLTWNLPTFQPVVKTGAGTLKLGAMSEFGQNKLTLAGGTLDLGANTNLVTLAVSGAATLDLSAAEPGAADIGDLVIVGEGETQPVLTLDFGEYQPQIGDKLLSWKTRPVGVKLAMTALKSNMAMVTRADGAYVVPRGLILYVE